MTHVVIIGGGPGGYEAALVAAQLGAEVTTQNMFDEGSAEIETIMLPLAGNPRAKMQDVRDGFVKLFARTGTGLIVVGPRASEFIHAVSLAVSASLTVDQVAHAFTVYPSMTGSVAEAARWLHRTSVD